MVQESSSQLAMGAAFGIVPPPEKVLELNYFNLHKVWVVEASCRYHASVRSQFPKIRHKFFMS